MAKSTKTKKGNPVTKENILEWYMADVLEGTAPANPYLFAKNHGISEQDFYKHYGSLEGVENHFFELIFDRTLVTLTKSKPYPEYPAKEKLLSFYYTFFANLTNHRSFVLHLLKPHRIDNLRKLKGLHSRFTGYVRTLNFDTLDLKKAKLNKVKEHAVEEASWVQLLSVLKFWYRDESSGFEKTDIFIEKLLTASFDLMSVKPLRSVADLGKFIFKEVHPVG